MVGEVRDNPVKQALSRGGRAPGAMGIPGEFGHRDYLAAVDRIVAACAAHAKAPAIFAIDALWAREYAAKGFRLMAYGVDQLLLQDALGRGLDLLRDAFHEAEADKGSPG